MDRLLDQDMHTSHEDLIKHLEEHSGVLVNPYIKAAFKAIDRNDFVAPDYATESYEDYPIPIGYGQTISQPTTVAFMLEKLDPRPGQKILDVGSGSGFATALLAHIVGMEQGGGSVYGVEIVPELVTFGANNLAKYAFPYATIEKAGSELGKADAAPFDRILVSAAAKRLPHTLVEQLVVGGIMVIPIGDAICRVVKTAEDAVEQQSFSGFAFVPLVI